MRTGGTPYCRKPPYQNPDDVHSESYNYQLSKGMGIDHTLGQ